MGDFKGTVAFGCKFPRGIMKTEMSCLKPHLISNSPRGKLACGLGCHDLLSRFMGSQGFFSGFVKDGKSIFKCGKEDLAEGGIGSGFITIKEGEWEFLSGAMWDGVMVEFGCRKELGP